MELLKYPLDKLLLVIAAILPGSVAILIYQSACPGSFDWFFRLGFLGYKTRLGLILLACFVVGYSMAAILSRFLGAIGGAVGGVVGSRLSDQSTLPAPWRNPQWRSLVKKQLGETAPSDTQLMSEGLLSLRRQLIEQLPESERQLAVTALEQEKVAAEMDDLRWQEWYNHYHFIILLPPQRDFMWHVENGLSFNLQCAALYVLVSAIFVPTVRYWWCILPACIWVFLLLVDSYWEIKRASNPSSTLFAQIRYLAGVGRGEKASDK